MVRISPENWLAFIFLALGRQNKSMDGSFNAILDHIENSSFFPVSHNAFWSAGDFLQFVLTIHALSDI